MRRVLLAALLVASLALVTVYSREGADGPLHTVQAAVSGAVAPLKFAGAAAGSAVDSTGEGIENLTADENTLSGLREYNAELIEQFSQLEETRQENERLRELLKLKDASKIEGVGARVIGLPSGAWDQAITIDKGTADGIDSGLTVMGASGVVGQVVSAAEHTATVRLITDPKSGAAALVQSSRAQGIVRGSLEGLLYLEDLDADADPQLGDIVLTSGLGGSYTRGLIIGTVVKVEGNKNDATRRVVVAPNDTTGALEEVLVVFSVDSDAASDASSDSTGSDSTDSNADSGDGDAGTTDGSDEGEGGDEA